jgi:hypothetical protein
LLSLPLGVAESCEECTPHTASLDEQGEILAKETIVRAVDKRQGDDIRTRITERRAKRRVLPLGCTEVDRTDRRVRVDRPRDLVSAIFLDVVIGTR